ncbi:aldo/keto reductase [Trametes versicolor FP-101664 SS1]|uniref:aldo/keto reductase n=1 Tax=Trametes versicolor (strain FP-101664) TaxID=717944 RepID=UPI0004621F98|nr:aldo/keto reductase [Trametes versicolor FP-101664 SS1]EIW60012.1 aldo/keto reductase [Trametes versicolor FP-101664 SS1]
MVAVKTVKLGGTASDITVGKVAHGLMMMTWRDPSVPLPDEEAFEAIKAGVDIMPPGVKMFLNSGEFYGPNCSTANLELLARFFDKYPEYAERTFLSVKGGSKEGQLVPDSSPENLRRSVDKINEVLRGTKRLDLFESARVAANVPLEDAIKTLAQLKSEGKFDHIGMSECSAASLRKANAVHPIATVEIEISLWSYEEETKKVIATAQELGIAVVGYSPLGRGFLTGTIKSPNDLPAADMRRHFSRFQEENFKHNMAIVDGIKAIAEKKNITPAQLSIAWVAALGPHVIPLPGSSNKKRNLENLAAGDVELTPAELAEIDDILAKHTVKGGRYNDAVDPKMLHLWG